MVSMPWRAGALLWLALHSSVLIWQVPATTKAPPVGKAEYFASGYRRDTPSTQQCLIPHIDTRRGDHWAVLHLRSRHYHSFGTVAEDRLGFPSSCRDTGRLHQLQKLKIELGAWWQQIRTTTGMRVYQCITLFSRGLWLKHIAKKALLDKKWHLWGHIHQMTGLRRRHAADCWQLQGKEFEHSYILRSKLIQAFKFSVGRPNGRFGIICPSSARSTSSY